MELLLRGVIEVKRKASVLVGEKDLVRSISVSISALASLSLPLAETLISLDMLTHERALSFERYRASNLAFPLSLSRRHLSSRLIIGEIRELGSSMR